MAEGITDSRLWLSNTTTQQFRTFPQVDPLLLRTDMSKPDDDTDVPSGFNEDARMERTPSRSSETRIGRHSAGH